MSAKEIRPEPPKSTAPAFREALARVRDVFDFYRQSPAAAGTSLELEDCTRDAARAAIMAGVSFPALCAELSRAAVESLPHDPKAAGGLGRSMTGWAAHVYERRAAS